MSDMSSDGVKTGMLYGVVRFFIEYRKRYRFAEIKFLWEGWDSWRKENYPYYKSTRRMRKTGDDTDFIDSLNDVKTALPLMGVTQESWYQLEADDLAAYYVFNRAEEDYILLVTTDQDWYGLSGPSVDILYRNRLLTYSDVEEELGYPGHKIGLYKSIKGDKSDDIPSIPRFPTKLAKRIARELDDISEVVDALREWGESKWADKVEAFYDQLEDNVRLVYPMEIDHDIDRVNGSFDIDALVEFLRMRSMEATVNQIRSLG